MTSKQSIPKLPAGVNLSDVFHLAADKYLAATVEEFKNGKYKYSCVAIEEALIDVFGDDYLRKALVFQKEVIKPGLKILGLDCDSTTAFNSIDLSISDETQAARYTWLKFCAMLAEEQEAAGTSWN